jgi:hypothetical protein
MPVHINEIVIRAVVGGAAERPPQGRGETEGLNREQLIAECVEQVMALLHEREER